VYLFVSLLCLDAKLDIKIIKSNIVAFIKKLRSLDEDGMETENR
jgi:hypothetical protein